MSTIRKTISFTRKDKVLQDLINNVPSYDVSHVIRQLMYDGIKYRSLVEKGLINDVNVPFSTINAPKTVENEGKSLKIEQNKPKTVKNEEKLLKIDDFEEEIDINSIKLEEIDENDEDLEDMLLNNS